MASLLSRLCLFFLLTVLVFALPSESNVPIKDMIRINGGNPTFTSKGHVVNLVLTKQNASGFQSIEQDYLYYRIDMMMKLPPGDSAGIVTTLYLSSKWESTHDEIDMEFLGNETNKPVTLHTNIYTEGKGNREMQFRLWFDPSAYFHTYSILWTKQFIIFYIDGIPIRVFPNLSAKGISFPTSKRMGLYASIWNADDWATQGGLVKTNWTLEPFVASYAHFVATPCPSAKRSREFSRCRLPGPVRVIDGVARVDHWTRRLVGLVQRKFMIYNYCNDIIRFPQGVGPECAYQNHI